MISSKPGPWCLAQDCTFESFSELYHLRGWFLRAVSALSKILRFVVLSCSILCFLQFIPQNLIQEVKLRHTLYHHHALFSQFAHSVVDYIVVVFDIRK